MEIPSLYSIVHTVLSSDNVVVIIITYIISMCGCSYVCMCDRFNPGRLCFNHPSPGKKKTCVLLYKYFWLVAYASCIDVREQ